MKRSSIIFLIFLLLSLTPLLPPAPGWATPPTGFQSRTLIISLNEPTALAFLPDGRMLILERGGTIRIVQPGATKVDPTLFLTLPNGTSLAGERGLLGIAIDPNFTTNHFIYVFYTAANPLEDRVSRFTVSGNIALPGSERVIWEDIEASAYYHHGGCVAFGPDGRLYISLGDFDVTPSAAMDLTSYRGKIVRVNADGTIPADNPFNDGAGPHLDAIWARGLRNPYRFSFDSATGRMYIGDVGSNNDLTSIEEINVGKAGANYGWPKFEGAAHTSGFTDPIFTYVHGGSGAAIIAGFVYRGSQFPAAYNGSLFYGDYVRSWVRRLTMDGSGNVTGNVFFEPNDATTGGPYGFPVDIKQGPDGALYYADIGDPFSVPIVKGTIRQIRYNGTNQPPVAAASSDVTLGVVPLTVHFSSAGSRDPDGKSLTYRWDFGNGTTSTQANPTIIYKVKGRYLIRLTVSNGTLSTPAPVLQVTAGIPPTVNITTPSSGTLFAIGPTVGYRGSAKDSAGATLPAANFSWLFRLLHQTHTHPYFGPVNGVSAGRVATNLGSHGFIADTRIQIILTVTDKDGLAGSASAIIYPAKNGVRDAGRWLDPDL